MKQYKLIKEYPGSPLLGTIAEFSSTVHQYVYFHKRLGIRVIIAPTNVENHPEFWKEIDVVTFKGCEVLSLIYSGNVYELSDKRAEDGNFKYYCDYSEFTKGFVTLESIVKEHNDPVKIFRIKRESDGKIFTIGDNIALDTEPCNARAIQNIVPKASKDELVFQVGSDVTISIDRAVEPEEILVVTHDGTIITEKSKDTIIYGVVDTANGGCNNDHFTCTASVGAKLSRSTYKLFDTLEKVKAYIVYNSRSLSVADVMKIKIMSGGEETLKKLVNERINGNA